MTSICRRNMPQLAWLRRMQTLAVDLDRLAGLVSISPFSPFPFWESPSSPFPMWESPSSPYPLWQSPSSPLSLWESLSGLWLGSYFRERVWPCWEVAGVGGVILYLGCQIFWISIVLTNVRYFEFQWFWPENFSRFRLSLMLCVDQLCKLKVFIVRVPFHSS